MAYVAKDDTQRRACHVLECGQQLAQDVITTIGQAFELRFKMFLSEQQRIGRNVMRYVCTHLFSNRDLALNGLRWLLDALCML